MADPRKPQDHKKKAEKVDPVFSFEHEGTTYTFERETTDVLTPGFIRKNRHDEGEMTYGLYERLADAETLDLLDNMTHKQWAVVMTKFEEHIQAVMGTSLGE